MTDRDPGDEHVDGRPLILVTHQYGGCWIGVHPPLFRGRRVGVDHDGGDEDDYHNYVPSVHPGIGLHLWAPR